MERGKGTYPHDPVNTRLAAIARTIRQANKRNDIQIVKEEIKLPLLTLDMILYIENIKNPRQQKIVELINKLISRRKCQHTGFSSISVD